MSLRQPSKGTSTASRSFCRTVAGLVAAVCAVLGCAPGAAPATAPAASPRQAVKRVFIHHSCGENWLNDSHGGLGKALAENNYYPTDGDDHPSPAGNRKATEEFVPLLNAWYARWSAAAQASPAGKPPAERSPEEHPSDVPALVETPQRPAQPAGASAASEIDAFEGDPKRWAAFLDDEKNARLSFARDNSEKHGGTASLRIDYDLAPESWAVCGLVSGRRQDWSGSGGLSLYLHAERAGETITVIAYGGNSPEDLLNFECTVEIGQAAVEGWQRVDLAWPRLRLPEWQGDASQKYDPRQAMGVGLALHSGDVRRAGRVWVDDVALVAPGK